jgi:hypothetical protein
VGLTQGFGDGDVEPPYTYRLQLTYYATSDYAATALTDRIVVTTGGYGADAPGDPHTVEMRFVTGSRDVLTRTARADGWIEARLDGDVILRVDDIKVFPSTEVVPWDSVVVCGAGSFTSWYVQQDAVYDEGFASPAWALKRTTDANTLWTDRVQDTTPAALYADLGGYWTRSNVANGLPYDMTIEGEPALWSNIDALRRIGLNPAPLGDQPDVVARPVLPGLWRFLGTLPVLELTWADIPPVEGVGSSPYLTRTIRRLRQSPHLSDEQQWLHYSRLQLDLEAGKGLTSGQGMDPQLMLQWSDDGGRTWSSEHWVGAGQLGQYKWRAIWRRLGRSRNRVFRVVQSDPTKVAWIDAFMELDRGTN